MNFKIKVHAHCHKLVDDRIALAQKLINEAQNASNQESKSSMGDKYETSREMMALEMRKAGEQIQESSKLKQVLSELNPELTSIKIKLGSLISTSIGNFYLSVSLGQVLIEDKKIFVLSAVSPMGKKLLNKREGDEFEFNAQKIEILAIK
jgi:hypothetical protein